MKFLIQTFLFLVFSASAIFGAYENIQLHAHQGEFFLAPPNSWASVKKAFDLGSKYVEFDVGITNSGEMICVHWDGELNAHWGITKTFADVTAEDIKNSKLSPSLPYASEYSDMKLNTLDQILAVTPKDGYLIVDVKRSDSIFPKKFDEALQKAGLSRSNMIVPHWLINEFRKISTEYDKATYSIYFSSDPGTNPNQTAEFLIADAKRISPYIKIISVGQAGEGSLYLKKIGRDFVKKIKNAGFMFAAWTTDSPALAKKLIDEYEADIIYTNKAADMREKLGKPRER